MDPLSAIIIGLIWAALRAPGEAGRSMRNDYRNRAGRWNSRAENWMGGRGRGGRRVAGYDRNGRAYRPGDRNRRNGKRRGDPGWRSDPRAWTGREGRARVARGVLPSAIRSGIIAGALACTAVFGLGVAGRGFARGLRGGYQMGRLHYLGKRNQAHDPTATVTPGEPGEHHGPEDEVVEAVIVEDPNTETPPTGDHASDRGRRDGDGWIRVTEEFMREDPPSHDPRVGDGPRNRWRFTVFDGDREIAAEIIATEAEILERLAQFQRAGFTAGVDRLPDVEADRAETVDASVLPDGIYRAGQSIDDALAANGLSRNGWLVSHFVPGSTTAFLRALIEDEAELDRRLASPTGLRVEVRRLSEVPDHELRDLLWHAPVQPETQDSRPHTAAGPTNPGEDMIHDGSRVQAPVNPEYEKAIDEAFADAHPDDQRSSGRPTNPGGTSMSETTVSRTGVANPGPAAQFVAVGAGSTISAPVLMEGANYDAHLHNLNVLAKEARAEYSSAELTLASASAARQRAEHAMAAVEQMAAGLAAQDFGETHVGNMASLHEMLARQVEQSRTAEHAAQESLATSEHLIELCTSAAAVFQRDHGQLAEAHANAPHAAKTREAYQPM
jgi:hypothetical protein